MSTQEPLFWYRPRSDGLYEGPIHTAQIEQVRKESGAWVPLYPRPAGSNEPSAPEPALVSRLDLQPGEKLVVFFDGRLSMDQIDRVKSEVKSTLGIVPLVLDGGAKLATFRDECAIAPAQEPPR